MSQRETHDRDSHEKQDHEKKDQEKKDHEKYEPKADHVTCRNTEKDHYDTKAVCDVALAALELAKQTECNTYLNMKAQLLSSAICDANNGDTYEVWAQRMRDRFVTLTNDLHTASEECTDAAKNHSDQQQIC